MKQLVSKATTDNQLSKLRLATDDLVASMEKLATDLQPEQDKLKAQLDVLGPAPAAGALPETPAVAQQRNALNNSKKQLDDAVKRAQAIKTSAFELGQQIGDLRRVAFKTQLALNTGSILGIKFWAPVLQPSENDVQRLDQFNAEMKAAWDASWQDEWRYGTLALLALAVIVWSWGRYFSERFLAWVSIRFLPDGRLRRSFMALVTVVVTVITTSIALNLLYYVFVRVQPLPVMLEDFAEGFNRLGIFCALIAGLGRAALSLNRPSWRLASMDNEVAAGLRYFSPLLAGLALAVRHRGADQQRRQRLIGHHHLRQRPGGGADRHGAAGGAAARPAHSAPAGTAGRAPGKTHAGQRAGAPRHPGLFGGDPVFPAYRLHRLRPLPDLPTDLGGAGADGVLFYGAVRHRFVRRAVFAADRQRQDAEKTLSFKDRHLEQMAIITTALAKCSLLLLMIVSLFNGSFGSTTPGSLMEKIVSILTGEGLQRFNIVPGNLLNAVICLAIGIYILRAVRRWLGSELLPKTISDVGIRASLVTLFSNIGYVLVILITLAALGIQWSNLAWIVSALSVGIGFGLQEIVKNFISGLILLTERPVKVGDMIGIGGVEGDVRRINVRATEIQLSDRSTMIVPNSQLISQNVRNATMGNAQGVVTIALTFPTDIDPEQVRNILLNAYHEYENILETPAPYVRFSQLGPDGIILSVTGYVPSPRMVGATKSELLFNILKLLRAQRVSLSSPQEVVFMKQQATRYQANEEEHSS